MKLSKIGLTAIAATLLISLTVQAKNEMKKAYVFGFASSFNDSTVYFTDIQEVDSAWFTSKHHFLVSRENYSYQLRDYLASIGEQHRTCVVEYDTDPKKLEKVWNKLYIRYAHNQKQKNNQKQKTELPPFQIKKLNRTQFQFQAVAPMDEATEIEEPVKKVKAKKAQKKQRKNK